MPNAIKSRASTGEKPRINSDILALLMHGYSTFNMLVPEPFRKVPLLLDPILGIVQRICGALIFLYLYITSCRETYFKQCCIHIIRCHIECKISIKENL